MLTQTKSQKSYPKWYYIVLIIIPVITLAVLELGLRIFNYGTDHSTFVTISEQFDHLLFFNPKLPQKYFGSGSVIPSVIPDGFEKIKRKNCFRVFVLGGSSAAGFPYPTNASFSRQLKRKLEILYPFSFIEVINLGVSAVNSNTIRDIIDDVLEQQPDLILIYAGHNEYYGAYGAASNSLLSANTTFLPLYFDLKSFRTFQLVENIIGFCADILKDSDNNSNAGRTLMAEMAGENIVEFQSDSYWQGLTQFERNLSYIIAECKKKNVIVINGTLTSNLMQSPLDKIIDTNSEAVALYNTAINLYEKRNFNAAARSLFDAKEFDALRFRAPERMNEIIKKVSKKYEVPFADIQSEFLQSSENNITNFVLFVDHLHPNIKGCQIIADVFFREMEKLNYLPGEKRIKIEPAKLQMIQHETFPLTEFDSTFADAKIYLLMHSYPFTKNTNAHAVLSEYKLNNYSDSLAMKSLLGKISWEDAHLELADKFLKENNYIKFFDEMRVLIEDKPFDKFPYNYASQKLINAKQYLLAEAILRKLYKGYPDYPALNKLGNVALNRKQYDNAIIYFNECLQYRSDDPEIYFNLSNAYYMSNKINLAIEAIEKCLQLNREYPNAKKIYNSLTKLDDEKK